MLIALTSFLAAILAVVVSSYSYKLPRSILAVPSYSHKLSRSSGLFNHGRDWGGPCWRRKMSLPAQSTDGPEIFPMGEGSEPEEGEDDVDSEDIEEVEDDEGGEASADSGVFKLKPTKQPMIFNGESPAPPVFRGQRNSRVSSASDNLIVIGLTIIILAASVSVFLLLNKDLPVRPPPPPMRF